MENIIYYNHFYVISRHISCASSSPVQRTKRGTCDSIHARGKFLWIRVSLSLSLFFCDNGLFLTRGASQNLRKRCHGKKRGGEQISPCSYGLCISCMARGILFKDCIQMRRGGENKNRVSLEGVSRKHRRMDGVMRTIRHGIATLLFSR